MAPLRKKPAAKPAKPAKKKARSRSAASPKRVPAKARPAAKEDEAPGQTVDVEVEPGRIEESIKKIGRELKHWANKGRYSKVRFKFRGKQLLPDLPLAAVAAAEGLSFYFPPARVPALLAHLAGGALLQVELVNDSEKRVKDGKDALLSGDLDAALAHFRAAAEMDRDCAAAHLNIGVALKLQGDKVGARAALETAKTLDPKGAVGKEAEKLLATLPPAGDPTVSGAV